MPVHAGEDVGGAGVVRRDVVGGVLEVDAEADLGGLVAHDVDAVEGGVEGDPVADVAVHERDALLLVGADDLGGVAVHVVAQGVEDADLVAVGQGAADDRGADEARAAGDQEAAHAVARSWRLGLHDAGARAASGRVRAG